MDVHKGTIYSIQSDPLEKRITTSCADGVVRVFRKTNSINDPLTFELEHELFTDNGPATKAIFINQGELIVSSYSNGKIVFWKLEGNTYNKKLEKEVTSGPINDISGFYKDNIVVISVACSDGHIVQLSLDSSLSIDEKRFAAHRFSVTCISSNSAYTISGGLDYSVAVWQNGDEVARFNDHKSLVRDVIIFNDEFFDIFCMASCGDDCKVFIYTKNGKEYTKQEIVFDEPVYSLCASRTGFTLTVGYGSNKFKAFVPDSSGKYAEVELAKID